MCAILQNYFCLYSSLLHPYIHRSLAISLYSHGSCLPILVSIRLLFTCFIAVFHTIRTHQSLHSEVNQTSLSNMSRRNQGFEVVRASFFHKVSQRTTPISLYGDTARTSSNRPQREGYITIPISLRVPPAQQMSERGQIWLQHSIRAKLRQIPEILPVPGGRNCTEATTIRGRAPEAPPQENTGSGGRGCPLRDAIEQLQPVSEVAVLADALRKTRLTSSKRRSKAVASGVSYGTAQPSKDTNRVPFPSRVTRKSSARAPRTTRPQLRGDHPQPELPSSPPKSPILTGANAIPIQPRAGDTQTRLKALRAKRQAEQMARWGFAGYA